MSFKMLKCPSISVLMLTTKPEQPRYKSSREKNKITEHKVALAKNTRMKSRRDNLDQSPFTTGGQKTDRAHSFTYGARTGHRSRHNEILNESCNSDAVWIPTT